MAEREKSKKCAKEQSEERLKRQKVYDLDPIFKTFLDNKKRKELDLALLALNSGLSDLTFGVLSVEATNSLDIANFKDSTIRTSPLSLDIEAEVAKGAAAGDLFLIGVDILQNYLDTQQPKVPENIFHRKALQKLLIFLTSLEDHRVLLRGKDTKETWPVTLAQHLLSKLSVNSIYIMDSNLGCTLQGATRCPCEMKDELAGRVEDTSYGCVRGWHGKSDIIIEDLPVSIFQDNHNDNDVDDTGEDQPLSLDEVNVSEHFVKKDITQLLVQTIVFSFLQQKLNNGNLNNDLIPGIGIKSKYLMVCFYDTEKDVLLQSKPVELLEGKSLRTLAVLFLWLTLNYKLFCSGITHEMNEKQSGFIRKLGDDLHIYKNEVSRPVCEPCTTQQELYPWAQEPVTSEFRLRPSLKYRNVLLS